MSTRVLADALRAHWPEYLMEAAGLGLFMLSAAVVTTALEYPHSSLHDVGDPAFRRMLIGLGMGVTAVGIIYSPWGKQSGAHLNPAVTLTFYRLGKIEAADAAFYVLAQALGGLLGLLAGAAILGMAIQHPAVNYVVTTPGPSGSVTAFIAESVISFGLMLAVLATSNHRWLTAYTGLIAGGLVALFIAVEAPLSGMSMNPARTFASAVPSQHWTAFWIYLTAPLLGMLAAAELYVRWKGFHRVYCAKFHHHNHKRCIFRCGYSELLRSLEREQGRTDQQGTGRPVPRGTEVV